MTIRHLHIFRAVCEEGSITRAAERLYMTQPAVSHAVAELEREAGTPLFDRLGKKIYLNRRGELIYEKACSLLEVYDDLKKSMEDLEHRAALRIGSSITIANFWLPSLIRNFQEEFPRIEIKVTVDSARMVSESLRENELDLALIEGASYQEAFDSVPFSSYRVIPLCSPEYLERRLLPRAASVRPDGTAVLLPGELASERLLLREKGSAIRDVFDAAMLQRDLELSASWVSVNSQALLRAAVSGLGITFLPDMLAEEYLRTGRLASFAVEGTELRNENHVALLKGKYLSAPVKRFRELTLEMSRDRRVFIK